jgi:hypothetical protein
MGHFSSMSTFLDSQQRKPELLNYAEPQHSESDTANSLTSDRRTNKHRMVLGLSRIYHDKVDNSSPIFSSKS